MSTWNAGNSSVKRIMREAKEMRENPCWEFVAQPLEDNVFEWIFTMRGPCESEYENGFYRGRVLLPSNYPFAPPDIMLLTPNGRFELNKKICLSISSYHPENWHPTWGIKTVLQALREFMNTPGNNGIGAIEYTKENRKQLAKESHNFICPVLKVHVREDIEIMNASPKSTSDKPNEMTPPTSPSMMPVTPSDPISPNTSLNAEPSPEPKVKNEEPQPAAAVVEPAQPAPITPTAPATPAAAPAQAPAPVNANEGFLIEERSITNAIRVVALAIAVIIAKKAVYGGWLSALSSST